MYLVHLSIDLGVSKIASGPMSKVQAEVFAQSLNRNPRNYAWVEEQK